MSYKTNFLQSDLLTSDKIGSRALKVQSGFGGLTVDAWGVPKVSLAKSLLHGMFTFDIPASHWFMYENGTQVYTSNDITSVNSAGRLLTTATNTELVLESRECPRYQPNRGHLFSTALWCPNKTNDGTREWGLATADNGVFFRLKADGNLYAVRVSGGVEKAEELINTDVDVEKGNVYDIQYQWRGVGNYKFYINLTLVHEFNLLGALTELSMENPALPAYFKAVRNTQDVGINIGCVDITSENGIVDQEVYNSMYAEAVSVTTNTPVIVLKHPATVDGKINTRTVTLARITVNASKKATFKVWMSRNPADITGAVFRPIASSFLETDSEDMDATATKATAVNIANLRYITSIPVEALVSKSVDNPYRGRIEFPIVRGDYLIVTGSGASASAECVIEVGEQI